MMNDDSFTLPFHEIGSIGLWSSELGLPQEPFDQSEILKAHWLRQISTLWFDWSIQKKEKGQHVGLDPSFGFDLADQEADREVAILLKDTGDSSLPDKRVKNSRKINRKSTEHKYKLSSSAPILTIPDLPPVTATLNLPVENETDSNSIQKEKFGADETPILYGCSLCNFLCTEKHFIAAHMQIEHVSVRKSFIFTWNFTWIFIGICLIYHWIFIDFH